MDLPHFYTTRGTRLLRQQVKTILAAGLEQKVFLFYIRDKNTGYLFQVDSEAQIRNLKAKTVPNKYIIPHLQDFAIDLPVRTVLTKLVLVKVYQQTAH